MGVFVEESSILMVVILTVGVESLGVVVVALGVDIVGPEVAGGVPDGELVGEGVVGCTVETVSPSVLVIVMVGPTVELNGLAGSVKNSRFCTSCTFSKTFLVVEFNWERLLTWKGIKTP